MFLIVFLCTTGFQTCFVMEFFSLVSNVLEYCNSLCNVYCLKNKMKCGFGGNWWLFALFWLYRWTLNVWQCVLSSVKRFHKTCFEKDLHKGMIHLNLLKALLGCYKFISKAGYEIRFWNSMCSQEKIFLLCANSFQSNQKQVSSKSLNFAFNLIISPL